MTVEDRNAIRKVAALALPEPQGPTGRPAIEPVPIAERLPGPEDCDAEGRCWWLRSMGLNPVWDFCKRQGFVTHWLPHHALPVPR